jgi:hypothetical protein
MNYFRYQYLTDAYHQEKWAHREAWIQLAQNANEACEAYCNFPYCINGWFIPRRDWLVYFTYTLSQKAPGHERLKDAAYNSVLSRERIESRYKGLQEIGSWMTGFCRTNGWVEPG